VVWALNPLDLIVKTCKKHKKPALCTHRKTQVYDLSYRVDFKATGLPFSTHRIASANAPHCIGYRTALHRLSHRIASAIAPRCVLDFLDFLGFLEVLDHLAILDYLAF
jgi:hypothetical protein